MQIFLLFLFATCTITACNPLGNDGPAKDSTAIILPNNTIDEARPNPKTAAVATYEKPVPNDLNKWFFRVQLFETKQRFVYNLKMQYEEINEEQLITFPNLKMEPQPQIKAGKTDLETIIGFLDNKGVFKEYLQVSSEDGNLKLKTLKHYAVYAK